MEKEANAIKHITLRDIKNLFEHESKSVFKGYHK